MNEENKLVLNRNILKFFQIYQISRTNLKLLIIACFFLSFILTLLGVLCLINNKRLIDEEFEIKKNCLNVQCSFIFHIDTNINRPLFFFIGFENFHTNHIKVINSLDINELKGDSIDSEKLSDNCLKYKTVADARRFHLNFNQDSNPQDRIFPCGLFPLIYSPCWLTRFN